MRKNALLILLLAVLSIPNAALAQRSKRWQLRPTQRENFTIVVGDCKFEMVYVSGGTFMMGASNPPDVQANSLYNPTTTGISKPLFADETFSDELPRHAVNLYSFYLGQYEVTQQLWVAVMGYNPSNFVGPDLPVEQVSYEEVQEFIHRLNEFTGLSFRLPTEAEWEYAARGGSMSRGYSFPAGKEIFNIGWTRINSDQSTHPVGALIPNELGLYDMCGNVWEWCNDYYGPMSYHWDALSHEKLPDYVTNDERLAQWEKYKFGTTPWEFLEEIRDPHGPDTGECRVGRGGSWADEESHLHCSYRNFWPPDRAVSNVGFRLALSSVKDTCHSWMPNQYILDSVVGGHFFTSTSTESKARLAQGLLEGTFSIGPERTIRFSKGNLQYNAAANMWRFADHQYDYIGDPNRKYGKSYAGWIDLFAWGTSGYRDRPPYYFSPTASNYGGGNKNIEGTSYDWGVYNKISNGGNHNGLWRTLSVYEWDYLLTQRPDAWLLRTTAVIGNVQGLVLLPDDWLRRGFDTLDYKMLYTLSLEQWDILERAGAVFLPAAGVCHFADYIAGLTRQSMLTERSQPIEGFDVGYGQMIPMVTLPVYSKAPTNSGASENANMGSGGSTGGAVVFDGFASTPSSINYGNEDILAPHQKEFIAKSHHRSPIETDYGIGYYWTTIHYDKHNAYSFAFAISRLTYLMPIQRLTRCSVRLVQDTKTINN